MRFTSNKLIHETHMKFIMRFSREYQKFMFMALSIRVRSMSLIIPLAYFASIFNVQRMWCLSACFITWHVLMFCVNLRQMQFRENYRPCDTFIGIDMVNVILNGLKGYLLSISLDFERQGLHWSPGMWYIPSVDSYF